MPNPPAENLATLPVSRPDRRGIVAALAQLLDGRGANILDAGRHTDAEEGPFFQRIRFDMSELHTDRSGLRRALDEVAGRFDMTWRLSFAPDRKRVAIEKGVLARAVRAHLADRVWVYGNKTVVFD